MSATCEFCDQDMTAGIGCTLTEFNDFTDGITRQRLVYTPAAGQSHCRDCNTPAGQLHHAHCVLEDCPKCGGQANWCECETIGGES